MSKEEMSLDSLLKIQSRDVNLVTIEPILDQDSLVKITPWDEEFGCNCEYSFVVDKSKIDKIYKTEYTHRCCGKNLQVVEIVFVENATLKISDLLQQQSEKSKSKKSFDSESYRYNQEDYGVEDIFDNEKYEDGIEEIFEEESNKNYEFTNCPRGYRQVSCNGTRRCVSGRGSCCGNNWCSGELGGRCVSCSGRQRCVTGPGRCCSTRWCPHPGRCVTCNGRWHCVSGRGRCCGRDGRSWCAY